MRRGTRGLTLVEVMIGSVVLSFLVLAVFLLIHRGATTYASASRHETLTRGARVVLDRVSEELRMANPDTLVVGTGSLTFQVSSGFSGGKTAWSSAIEYGYELSDVDANNNGKKDEGRLVREQGGQSVRLCDYVKAGGFVVSRSGNRLTITLVLAVENAPDTSVTTSIVLRNKSAT